MLELPEIDFIKMLSNVSDSKHGLSIALERQDLLYFTINVVFTFDITNV